MSKSVVAGIAALLMWTPVALSQQTLQTMEEDATHVRDWNSFAEACVALHEKQLAGREVREEERLGGYVGDAEFYREVSYYDRDSGVLLSRVQWEREQPDRVHALEVYVHDEQGRVLRDYAAAYLPDGRNAPIQTLINLHAYNGGLHAFRQFDASGARIYEFCEGDHGGEPVRLQLFEEDLVGTSGTAERIMASPVYSACFDGLPAQAGRYLDPH